MSRFIFLIQTLILLFNIGCSVGPKYVPPVVETPQTWKNIHNNKESSVYADYWWEVFEDQRLNTLEQEALSKNYDLETAFIRIQEARAFMEATKANLYPQLYLKPAYNNREVLLAHLPGSEECQSCTDSLVVRAHRMLYLLPLCLSYELDLWGKIRNRYYAARDRWEGQIEAYHSVLLILTADLATVYYQILTLDAQIDLLLATLAAREKGLKITQNRYKAKIVDYSNVTRAGLEVSTTLARYHEVLRLRSELENRLATLIGVPSSEFCLEHHSLQGFPPEIPAGIPSEVLIRRPDIVEAERIVAAEHALIKSAYASFFPSLTLTGEAGYSSPHLRYFLKNRSRLWSFGAHASQVIFDADRLAADLVIQETRFSEASASYQQQVLISFQEVEDALSNLENYGKEFNNTLEAVEWANKTYRIANNRYKNGLTFYLDVVDIEEEKLSNEILLNNLRGLRFASTIQLIKALGGSWNNACLSQD